MGLLVVCIAGFCLFPVFMERKTNGRCYQYCVGAGADFTFGVLERSDGS